MSQLDLRFGRMPAGSQPVETSEESAAALSPEALHKRRLSVLKYFASRGAIGATADEAVDAFGMDTNQIAPRVTELHKTYKWLEPTGARRKTRLGGGAMVLRINEAGRNAVRS